MYIVQLEFKRIQTFLFSSSRFKDMVGANAMLGNVLRRKLPELHENIVKTGSRCTPPSPPNISLNSNDALSALQDNTSYLADNPDTLWQQGILSRDGGHFYAAYNQPEDAKAFIKQAEQLIERTLPGVQVSYSLTSEEELNAALAAAPQRDPVPQLQGDFGADNFPQLPVFQPCQFGERGVAEAKAYLSKTDVRYQSRASQEKISFLQNEKKPKKQREAEEEAGDSGKPKQSSADVASSLMRHWIGDQLDRQPQALDQLVGTDYLAVIVADGNSMGDRFKAYAKQAAAKTWLERQAVAERFFYSARSAMRCAVTKAIESKFQAELQADNALPFQLLMLGGDDLLLACRAKDALELANQINQQLAEDKNKLADGQAMTLGIGVAIASHNLPFYRLHQVAEELASSAKVLARAAGNQQHSAIDWQVVTQSWVDDPLHTRRSDSCLQYRANGQTESLLLTSKPYLVNSTSSATPISLEKLLEASDKLYQQILNSSSDSQQPKQQDDQPSAELARSQLRYLQGELGKGRLHTEAVWSRLPNAIHKAFKAHLPELSFPWLEVKRYQDINFYQTLLGDLIELIEINTLSRGNQRITEDNHA